MESNDSPVIPDRGETSDIPGLPSGFFRTVMTVIVSVVYITSLGWVISQSTGLKLAAKSVICANKAMGAARQMHSAIKNERVLKTTRTVFRIKH